MKLITMTIATQKCLKLIMQIWNIIFLDFYNKLKKFPAKFYEKLLKICINFFPPIFYEKL